MKLDLSKVVDIECDGIDMADYPDFCDSCIKSASLDLGHGNFRDLTESELDDINENHREFVYEKVWNYIH